jgi:hypothetical protein
MSAHEFNRTAEREARHRQCLLDLWRVSCSTPRNAFARAHRMLSTRRLLL